MVLVSVIIPLYNKKNYILRAIYSVLNQTVSDIEIIIIDDGSLDGSGEEVKAYYDPRIRLYRQKNQGVSIARNNGVKYATSDFIAFLDADDEWLPEHLETLLRLRENFPEAGIFTSAYKILERNGKYRLANYKAIPNPPFEGLIPNYFRSATLGDSPLNSSSMAVTKDIFYEMGGFSKNAWWGEDVDFWGRIALKYPVAFSWEVGAVYHWDAENRVCGKPSLDPEPFVIHARSAIEEGNVPSSMLPDVKEYLARKEIYRAASNLYSSDKKTARRILGQIQTGIFRGRKMLLQVLSFLPDTLIRFVLRAYFS